MLRGTTSTQDIDMENNNDNNQQSNKRRKKNYRKWDAIEHFAVFNTKNEADGKVFYRFAPNRCLAIFMFALECHLRDSSIKLQRNDFKLALKKYGEQCTENALYHRESSLLPALVDKFKLLVKEETEKTTYYSIAPDYENILSQLTDFNFQTNVKTPTVFAKDPRLSYDLSEMVKELKNACIKSSQDVTTDEKFSSQFNMSSHHQSKKPRASSSVNTPILIDDTSPYSKYIVYRSRHEKEGQVFYHYGPTRSLMVFMFILEYSLRNPTQKITQAEIKKCLHDMGELIKKNALNSSPTSPIPVLISKGLLLKVEDLYAKYTLAPDYETKLASLTINDFKVSAQAVTVFKKQDNVEYNILQMSQELKQAFEAEKKLLLDNSRNAAMASVKTSEKTAIATNSLPRSSTNQEPINSFQGNYRHNLMAPPVNKAREEKLAEALVSEQNQWADNLFEV